MDAAAWDIIDRLAAWLTEGSSLPPETQTLLQLMKLSEEVGEVAEAVIGATGQNPRKGFSHDWDDVTGEVCDVIVTAMVALTRLTADPRAAFTRHLDQVAQRSLGGVNGAEAAETGH